MFGKKSRLFEVDKNCKYIIFIIFFLTLILNILTPLVADDFAYATSSSLLDVFTLEYQQYMNWGGRSIAHIIARIFLMGPKVIFSVVNTFVYLLLNCLLYFHVDGSLKIDKPWLLILVSTSVFLFVPSFGQTCLWLIGSCNYLWTACFILAFLLPFRLFFESMVRFNYIYIILLGILAGWSNENFGGACIFVLFCFFVFKIFVLKDKNWMPYFVGILSVSFGFLMMILAPGNYVRAAGLPNLNGIYEWVHQFNQLLGVFFNLKEGLLILVIAWCVTMAVLSLSKKSKDSRYLCSIYFLASLACGSVMILTPVTIYYDRSQFGTCLLMIISVLIGIKQCSELSKSIKPFVILTGITSGLTLATYGYALLDNGYFFIQNYQRQQIINQTITMDLDFAIVKEWDTEFMTFYNPSKGLLDISNDYLDKENKEVANYYEIQGIIKTQTNHFKNAYQNGDITLMNIFDFYEYASKIANNAQYSYMIVTNQCDDKCNALLAQFDIHPGSYHLYLNNTYFHTILDLSDEQGIETFTNLYDKEVYLSSYDEGINTNIVIDDIEYTLDNPGITIVVFDNIAYRVVDVVNFNDKNNYAYAYRSTIH